jgi:hypothetical protein
VARCTARSRGRRALLPAQPIRGLLPATLLSLSLAILIILGGAAGLEGMVGGRTAHPRSDQGERPATGMVGVSGGVCDGMARIVIICVIKAKLLREILSPLLMEYHLSSRPRTDT